MTRKNILAALFLGTLAFVLNYPFVKAAPAIMYSDWGLVGLLTDYLRSGHWSPFMFQQQYGGCTVAVLRAVWQDAWFLFTPESMASHLHSAEVFTYAVMPSLLTMAAYALCRAYVNGRIAFISAICVAFGFHFMTLQIYGGDYHAATVIFGCLLLSMRSRFSNPLLEMPPRRLVASAVLTGLAVFTCHAALIYAVAFWVPWEDAWPGLKRAFSQREPYLVLIAWLFWIFVSLGLYIDLFGTGLGRIAGKRIFLDSGPNWDYAKLCLVALLASLCIRNLKKEHVKRLVMTAAGFSVGFFPELWQSLVRDHRFPGFAGGYSQSFERSMWVIGKLPDTFRTLVSGDPTRLTSMASVIFCGSALAALGYRCARDKRIRPIAISGLLAVFAYIRIRTYTDEAPTRYLVPMLPAMLFGFACLFQYLSELRSRPRKAAFAFAATLICAHLGGQVAARAASTRELLASGRIAQIWDVVGKFKNAGVNVVFSTDYGDSQQYSYFAEKDPIFLVTTPSLEPFSAAHRIAEAKHAGFMSLSPTEPGEVTIRGRRWLFRPLGQVGDFHLFVGDPS